jgi:hypothetical protein
MEHDHVNDNLPAKLLRIQTFGKMKLEEFKDRISSADYKTCEFKMDKNPTWYPLTLDVFVKFLYKVIFLSLCLCVSPLDYCHSFTFFLYVVERVVERNRHCGKVVPEEYTGVAEVCSQNLGYYDQSPR